MKRISIFAILTVILMGSAVSCRSDMLETCSGDRISLKISSKTMSAKATMTGEDVLNENAVNTVYYFFYKDGESSAAPVVKGCLKNFDLKEGVKEELIPVTAGTAGVLFESSDKCSVFIVANPVQSLESLLSGSPTLEQLRSALFCSSLAGTQESFTMIYDAAAGKEASIGNIMTVAAQLRRLACKVTVSLNVSKADPEPSQWRSVPADATVELHNAFAEAALGGDFATVKEGDSNFDDNYFNTSAISFGSLLEGPDDKWTCRIEQPVYTYPMAWEYATSNEPYLLVDLPWESISLGERQHTYYKVLFNVKELTLNSWYDFRISLDRLGSFFKEDPVQDFVDMECIVIDWNNAFESEEGIVSDVDDARFLMMNQTEYFLYNQDSWNFPYTSSHECEIVMEEPEDETYERMNYRRRNAELISGKSREMGVDKDGNPLYDCTLDGSLITFYHKLNNDFTSTEEIDDINYGNYDVVPYTFKLTIRHKDNHAYKQQVIVHQYPAIYIEAQPNSAGVKLEPGTGQQSTTYLLINPLLVKDGTAKYTDEEGNPTNFIGKAGTTLNRYQYYGHGSDPQTNTDGSSMTIGNSNGNMYVITTAVPPIIDGVECMLADPRQFTSNITELRKDYNENGEELSELYKTIYDMNVIYHPSNFGDLGYPLTEEDKDIFEEAPALYGGSPRTLTYYYPTKSTKEVENVIAPKLRVASSWGQTHMLCYDKAVRRCAAYQEDGYPAGRWRVPTKAEVMYICKLSSDHVIPQLFGQFSQGPEFAAKYWCSTGTVGVYKVEEADGTLLNASHPPVYTYESEHPFEGEKSIAVRCVYDEWYWENRDYDNGTVATEKGRLPQSLWRTPYWGDMLR